MLENFISKEDLKTISVVKKILINLKYVYTWSVNVENKSLVYKIFCLKLSKSFNSKMTIKLIWSLNKIK